MCGRARCTLRADDIPRACYRTDGPVRSVNLDRYRPSYNVSPGSNLPVVRPENGGDGYAIHCMQWGLIPSFTKKTEKPDFYRMFNARSEAVKEKASFRRLLPKSRCLVTVEGFYEWKKDGSKKQPYYIHFKDGRPLVFAALYDSWQNSEGIETSCIVWYPVTPAMGKSSFDGPECIKEIHLKTEEKNTISKFFSRKEIKEESNLEESTHDKSVKLDLPSSVKEEHESEEKFETPCFTKPVDYDVKSSVETFSHEGETKCKTKRDRKELVDSKLDTDEIIKLRSSPAKKKANLKSRDDKQPTLLSYFGKK
ncbi:unnamed protein product [Dovyalis caffra]|uniref:Embryonic stem cell-specific 5-hydroxymethylcytosine-binding protein n=1 Tax=Dovyalis caffra TaxID=77055 RepID=A0AAV1SD97_9ROSI|nr:unnamed protein product [Dovyalis caffra]